jgi:formylglycine-generating enzyme required for sulfatase activity
MKIVRFLVLAVVVCVLMTGCAGMEKLAQEMGVDTIAYNPLKARGDSVLFKNIDPTTHSVYKKMFPTFPVYSSYNDTWIFYTVDGYAENGTIFYAFYNIGGKATLAPYEKVGSVLIYNPRVNLVISVPNDMRKAEGYRSTVSGKTIYGQLEFYRPVGKTKYFLDLLSTNQAELPVYMAFVERMREYQNLLDSRPVDEKSTINAMNSYFAEHKNKACSISAKLKAADLNDVSSKSGWGEKYCTIGLGVLKFMVEDLRELRGGYQNKYNGLGLSDRRDKNLGYEKVNLWEDMPAIMKKLPVSYESKLGKNRGVYVHDGPEKLWLIDTPLNFLTAFSKLGAETEISKPTPESHTLNVAAPEIELVHIKGGCIKIGSTSFNIHEVCVDDFYMGKYEVTQGQWKAIMGDNPSNFKDCGDNCPVENVNWFDAQNFINKLNQKTGKKYRLPTEAEWKYSAYKSGRNEREGWSGTNNQSELGDYAWWNKNAEGTTHPVGQKKPNKVGLYDMSGNVSEWVNDWYALDYENAENRGKIKDGKYDLGVDYNKDSLRNNPKGPQSGKARVICGSSWKEPTVWNFKINLRNSEATDSYPLLPTLRFNDNGFRLLLPVEK